ncbi:MAG: alpha/beta hydrolase [Flavobacteriaceae bacterium]|nr:alpha/beta hydrolase [Flavobacteriaceae bacterium]
MHIHHKGAIISFSDEGSGSVLVLLHGFLENSSMWNQLKPKLIERYRVISIDLLGHGKTECLGYVHSMEQMAEAVEAVLHHLKIRRSVFVGHSMGGYVALAFAEKQPDSVKGLVLLNSTTRADSKERKINRDRAIKAVKVNHKSFVRMAISNLFRPKNRTIFSEAIKVVKKEALQTPLQGIVAALEGMKIREDREALLHFSPYQKLMIIGKKDPVLNFEESIEQANQAGIETVILPDGHMSHIENHEEVSEALLSFIKSC